MNSARIRRMSWCICVLTCCMGSAQAATIYSLTTPLDPVSGSEFASGSASLLVDTTSTLSFGLSYQLQGRVAVLASLSAGGSPLLLASGLPSVSTLLYPAGVFSTSIAVDSLHFLDPASVLSSLLGQAVSISLTTSAGVLAGSSFLQGNRQGGGPPFPDFGEVPEPSTFRLFAGGIVLLTILGAVHRSKRSVRLQREVQ